MVELLGNWLIQAGIDAAAAEPITRALLTLGVLALAWIANVVTKRLILRLVKRAVERTKTDWDDYFLKRKAFSRLSHLAPAVVVQWLAPVALAGYPEWVGAIDAVISIYVIAIALLVGDATLNAALDIYHTFPISKKIPIRSFVQVAKVILYFLGAILIVSALIGQSPVVLVAGLGALSAVLLLVFQEPLLGLVAGVQLTANKMIQRGDWIEMPQFNADGDVLDVSLTTVQVQNWDKTISFIPTSAFLKHTFRNWRGMSEAGGRRIKRAICLDMNSIRFCDARMLEKFAKIQFIRAHLDRKLAEIAEHNKTHRVDDSTLINGRHLTNVGTFRAYLEAYLRQHPQIHQNLTLLVRQLAPGPQGLPIEIYAFSRDTAWVNYEAIQADVFDHVLAVVFEFELRVFQQPTGRDFRSFGAATGGNA